MKIEIDYVHFNNLNKSVLDLGKQVRELAEGKARYREMCDELDARCNELKAEVERLTKAGDKMAHIHRFVGFPSYTLEWEAAKEGKQP